MEVTVKNIINLIIDAANHNSGHLRDHLNREDPNDHSYIELFQNEICKNLRNGKTAYKWKVESKCRRRIEEDSVDIMGTCNNQPSFIIEIDASRGDQVAKKLLSRIDLWGRKEPIHYIALLYPDTQYGKVQSEKFVRYGNDILKAINTNSSAFGIYLDILDHNNTKIEFWDFNKKEYKINNKSFNSMTDCATEAIKTIIQKKKWKSFQKVERVFNKEGFSFVNNNGSSRAKKIQGISFNIYVYSSWREYGNEWKRFKKICKDNGCRIENVWNERAE